MKNQHLGEIKLPLKRIHIELTNVCNFDCTFCPKFKMTRPYGYMELSLAKKIIKEIAEEGLSEKITFHIMGEPLMHKDFKEILLYAKEMNLPTGITNNGAFLNEQMAEEFARSDVSQVNISLQTPNEEAYKTRVARKLEFTDYRDNILAFIKKCRELKPNMKLKLHFLNTTYSKKIEKIVGELHIMNGKEEIRENLTLWAEMISEAIGGVSKEEKEKIDETLRRLKSHQWNVIEIIPGIFFETYILNSWGDALRDEKQLTETSIGYCSGLQDHLGILWDGRLIYCCKDFDGKTASDININAISIKDALLKEDIQKVVQGFNRYKVLHP
ncbi:MAG: radical SAM protein, partial [Nitrospinae bacterium]|nr:radical SAM protein [Nitrospinota bacterium]